jgi:hypothetical protein
MRLIRSFLGLAQNFFVFWIPDTDNTGNEYEIKKEKKFRISETVYASLILDLKNVVPKRETGCWNRKMIPEPDVERIPHT